MILSAAAVVPRLPDGRVLVGERTRHARSFPGFLAFPGGQVDDEDHDAPLLGGGDEEHAERVAALRELGEETGRWRVCAPDGERPPEAVRAFCAAIERGAEAHVALGEAGLVWDDRDLIPLGRWVTPDFMPRRFSVRQFLLPVDDDFPVCTAPSDELEAIGWVEATRIRERWASAEALLLPPIRHVVRCLDVADREGSGPHELVAALRDIRGPDVPEVRDIVEGVAVQPYRTPTLPPATHTNCVLLGSGDFLIVDPATHDDDERARFDRLLSRLASAGRRPIAIVCTHHHIDHVGDVERVRKQHGLEVWAHARTAALVDFAVDRELAHDEVLALPGTPPRTFRVLFTPGHAAGHICLYEPDLELLVCGDMVAAIGSILIDPDEGHMGTYLESLASLVALPVRRVVSAHGPLIARGHDKLVEQLAHRQARQEQVAAALEKAGPAAPLDLVPGIYGGDTPPAMFPLAARSVLAALQLLAEQGRAEVLPEGRFQSC